MIRIVLLFSFLATQSGAQTISDTISVNEVMDSLQESDSVLNLPRAIEVDPRIMHEQKFLQYWNDEFPSSIVFHFHGIPNSETYAFNHSGKKIDKENRDWEFWMVLGLLAFLALIRFGYSKDFDELREVFKNWGINQQALRELGVGIPFGTVLLNIFSVIVVAFYAFILLDYFHSVNIEPSWILMIFSVGCVITVLLIRFILLKSAQMIFPFRKELKLFAFYETQINRLFSVIVFPMLLLIVFSSAPMNSIALYVSLVILFASVIIRYVKGFNLGKSYFSNHALHFLLYICTLEVAPVLIIVRIILNIGTISFSL